MNYVLMGIACIIFVYVLYLMGKTRKHKCDDLHYSYRPRVGDPTIKRTKRR